MVYFDMDGVLAVYDRNAYKKDEEGNMPFMDIPSRYFLHVEVDGIAMTLFKKVLKAMPDDVYVITSVSGDYEQKYRQTIDKMEWLHIHSPEFDIGSKFIAMGSDKRNFVTGIRGMTLNRLDILIDDYNPNLFKWAMAGGTSIKFINGVNSKNSWSGYAFDNQDSPEKLYLDLCGIITHASKINP